MSHTNFRKQTFDGSTFQYEKIFGKRLLVCGWNEIIQMLNLCPNKILSCKKSLMLLMFLMFVRVIDAFIKVWACYEYVLYQKKFYWKTWDNFCCLLREVLNYNVHGEIF